MVVSGQTGTGQWTVWRIGRRRLAWRPRLTVSGRAVPPQTGLDLIDVTIGLLLAAFWVVYAAVNWTGALITTMIVWPWRAVAGRWPVVAYVLDPAGSGLPSVRVDGLSRAAADELTRRWAADIKAGGGPMQP